MLSIENLSVDYGSNRIIDDLSLSLANDEILMLVGPTGCGKTTTLQAVAGLVPISDGRISLPGWSATRKQTIPPEKRNVGMVFQDFALFPHLSVEQNVGFRLDDKAPAEHWLDLLGLSGFRRAKPGQLSGGQKQRVALARALAHGPALMLLDEPLSNLDAALKSSLRWEIRDALKAAGVPAIWVTHDQQEALSVGDRVGVLKAGRLTQLDTPQQCFSAPADRFTASFLGEASFLPAQLTGKQAETVLGPVTTNASQDAGGPAEVLLRPDDCSLSLASNNGNGELLRAQFEGGAWLYTVCLDQGTAIQVRTNHENRIDIGARVDLTVASSDPLTAFTMGEV